MTCCPICRTELNDSDEDKHHLHDHLETRHGFKKCDKCPLPLYLSPGNLDVHNKRYHTSEQVARRKRHHHGRDPDNESPPKREKGSKILTQQELKDGNDVFYVDISDHIKQTEPNVPFKSEHIQPEKDSPTEIKTKDPTYLPEVDDDIPELSQPDKFNRDPLKGFFLQTVLECKECPERPTRKFAFFNSWQIHMKSQHKDLASITLYKVK